MSKLKIVQAALFLAAVVIFSKLAVPDVSTGLIPRLRPDIPAYP